LVISSLPDLGDCFFRQNGLPLKSRNPPARSAGDYRINALHRFRPLSRLRQNKAARNLELNHALDWKFSWVRSRELRQHRRPVSHKTLT
jgi:hypothetical protein